MKKFINFLNKLEEVVLVSMFCVMVLIIFIQVIMRYAFNSSLSWSEELGKFLFVWISWVGISIGARKNEHIKITMLTDKLSPKMSHIINIISEVVVMCICAVTVFYGISLIISQASTNFAGIKISMSWGYLSVVFGCIIMMLRNLESIISSIRCLSSPKYIKEVI